EFEDDGAGLNDGLGVGAACGELEDAAPWRGADFVAGYESLTLDMLPGVGAVQHDAERRVRRVEATVGVGNFLRSWSGRDHRGSAGLVLGCHAAANEYRGNAGDSKQR